MNWCHWLILSPQIYTFSPKLSAPDVDIRPPNRHCPLEAPEHHCLKDTWEAWPGFLLVDLLCILHGPGLSGTTGAHPGSLPAPFRTDNRCSAQLGTRPCVRPGRHTGDRTLETDSATNSRPRGKMEKASDIYTKVLVPALNGANIRDRIQMEVRWGVGQRGGGCLGTQDIRPKLRSEG